ncbi:hypothetical protein BJX68DRAFT_245544 [Aspergillus pseudodeflectus]|uniref:Fungal STAND N-terminal Goodbye domain-containing protein n=1 Tax=Aspergillus pseudodeflectus TaxID=176178 RepID=A0ABR4JN86_9EURO
MRHGEPTPDQLRAYADILSERQLNKQACKNALDKWQATAQRHTASKTLLCTAGYIRLARLVRIASRTIGGFQNGFASSVPNLEGAVGELVNVVGSFKTLNSRLGVVTARLHVVVVWIAWALISRLSSWKAVGSDALTRNMNGATKC